MIVYVNDNYEKVLDFPRFYLYENEWNRMHFTARLIELLSHPRDCSSNVCTYLYIQSKPPIRNSKGPDLE